MTDAYWMGKPGQELVVKTNRALTGATLLRLKVRLPDETLETWTPSSYDLVTGDIIYVTDGLEIDQVGEYTVQAYVEIVGVPLPPGDKAYFKVQKAIY